MTPRPAPRRRLRLGGLRTRLLVAFVLVSLLSAGAATALAYREARTAIVHRAQNAALEEFRDQVEEVARHTEVPPDGPALTRFAEDVADGLRDGVVVARYHDRTASSDPAADQTRVTAELRATVRSDNRLAFQRVEHAGRPWLVAGTPVVYDRARHASGLEVFAIVSLEPEQQDTAALLRTVRDGVLPVVGVAAVLALLAARTVLRPVRDLGRATRNLADGELTTRVTVTGRDELADLARTFNHTADALQTSVAELREQEATARRFVADVSHELRTPLAAMTMVCTVLDEDADQLPPDTAQAARTVSTETAKLAKLVEDLIEISRFDAGAAALTPHETDLADAVRGTLAARGWTGRVHAELPTGVRARVDRRRLDVVVANLVGNALRHGAPPVTVVLTATGEELSLAVSDRGPGLPPEAARHVFDRFYKADTARTRSEGSGLGMAIALENARLHGGTIEVADRPDGGAVFTLRLPRRRGARCGEDDA
ncbi:ATP-binding protein [Streptomyces pactum]|uniref:ATP-binding protein n=1 Tax=Streptomyces pactum TaxID=68249 RepID=UPI0037005F97